MLDGVSVELAEKVHLLFMANYIDYSDYEFRDENQVEGYCWCYSFESPMQKEIESAYQACHLRQKPDLSKRMADEMDINLEVFNLETDFFGDLHCSSRFTDMLCDAQAQYGDYSELWEKEGEMRQKPYGET